MSQTDVLEFAEEFLSKVSKLSVLYECSYNAPVSRGKTTITSKKPTVSIVEATLKRIHGTIMTSTVKFSQTEPTLSKLRREAALMLTCEPEQVVLIHDGKVLQDEDVKMICKKLSTPIYVFNKNEWNEGKGELCEEFRKELQELLKKYGRTDAKELSDKFLANYSKWSQ